MNEGDSVEMSGETRIVIDRGQDASAESRRVVRDGEDRLRFEMLLSELSARFVNLPVDDVDAAIEDSQRLVCEALGVDLSALWQWSNEERKIFTVTHLHGPPSGPARPEQIDAEVAFPWVFQAMLRGETLVLSNDDLPPEAARDLESRRHFGVESSVVIPLSTGGGPLAGVLTFDILQVRRDWSPEIVSRLTLVAQIFANALARRDAEEALRESELRLSLAADSAGAGLWSLDVRRGTYWLTRRARELFAFDIDELVTFERVLATVHPEDRELIRNTVREVTESGIEGDVEYRILRPDGSVRWIASRGRVQSGAGEEPDRLMGVSVDVTQRKEAERRLERALEEVKQLRDRLEKENVCLREQVRGEQGRGVIVGESEPIVQMLATSKKVAPTDAAVLITGETGTGKELLARAIHHLSPRGGRAMVKVNCAALPAPLIESELFGREKGAYTGAMTKQVGRFEIADGSTILLDEIGDLPLELQVKLLRVLEDGEYERLGSHHTFTADVRVMAATNRNLGALVRDGEFREDLFHRLNVFPIEVPPLRDRVPDIQLLVWEFIREFNTKMGKAIDSVPRKMMQRLERYAWPGNVRELRHLIERAVIVSEGRSLSIELPDSARPVGGPPATLEEVECRHIRDVLESCHWRISSRGGAAEILGLAPTTLHSRMKKLGIARPTP